MVNIASLMLSHASIDAQRLIARLEAPVFGFDLHWLIHCLGALELAKLVKAIHPDSLVIFGGISATYFAEELIRYDAVDGVVQGYDTLDVVARLMRAVMRRQRDFSKIPNLLYKSTRSEIVSTPEPGVGATAPSGQPRRPRRANVLCLSGVFRFGNRTSPPLRRVFIRPDGYQVRDLRFAWGKACRAAGVRGRLVHDVRRTAVRNLERAGVPRSTAMKLTGSPDRGRL